MRESSLQHEVDSREAHLDNLGYSQVHIDRMLGRTQKPAAEGVKQPRITLYESSEESRDGVASPLEPEIIKTLIDDPHSLHPVSPQRTQMGSQVGIQALRSVVESPDFQKNLTRNQEYGNE